ncbi:MAG: PaaI family thioesterase [Pseudomonadota bacterium]
MANPYFAENLDDLLTAEEMLSMSGLEFMERIRDGISPAPPIARTLNYRVYEVEKGRVVFRGAPLFDHMNPIRSVHGGWYGTLLDSCMACAVMTMLPKGAAYTTLEYKINITRPIPPGMEIDAVGLIQHAGRTTGVSNGEIRGVEDGKLYATGSTTCLIMTP